MFNSTSERVVFNVGINFTALVPIFHDTLEKLEKFNEKRKEIILLYRSDSSSSTKNSLIVMKRKRRCYT